MRPRIGQHSPGHQWFFDETYVKTSHELRLSSSVLWALLMVCQCGGLVVGGGGLTQPCRMPTRRLPSWRNSAWWPTPRVRSWQVIGLVSA